MSWLTVPECKLHLGKSTTADDEELYGHIEAAEAMIDRLIGTVRPSTAPTEEWHGGGRQLIVLDESPVAAVVSVAVNGVTVAQADLDVTGSIGWFASDLDMGAGIVRHTSWFSHGRVKVSYHPGHAVIPGNVRMAGLELVAHLWQSSQNGRAGTGTQRINQGAELAAVSVGYALPNRVRELLGLGKRATDEQLVG